MRPLEEGFEMRPSRHHPDLIRWESAQNEEPRHLQASQARGTWFQRSRDLSDFQDFNIICATWRLDFDGLAHLAVQDRLADRRLIRDLAIAGVGLCRANNDEGLGLKVAFLDGHLRT